MKEFEISYVDKPWDEPVLNVCEKISGLNGTIDIKRLASIIAILPEDTTTCSLRNRAWLLGVDLALNTCILGDLPGRRASTMWSKALACSLLEFSKGSSIYEMITNRILPSSGKIGANEPTRSIESHLRKVRWIAHTEYTAKHEPTHSPSYYSHFFSRKLSERAELVAKSILLTHEVFKTFHCMELIKGHEDKNSIFCMLPKEVIIEIVQAAITFLKQSPVYSNLLLADSDSDSK